VLTLVHTSVVTGFQMRHLHLGC